MNMVYNFSSFSVLPGLCIGCQRLTDRKLDLCEACEALLPANTPNCAHCALPLPVSAPSCGRCQNETNHFNNAVSAFVYGGEIATHIHAFKYHRKLAQGRVLSELLAQKIQSNIASNELPDMLIPVPLHWLKLIRRGYNQADEIARILSLHLNLPIQRKALARVQRGSTQSDLSRKQRLVALKAIFATRNHHLIKGKNIALIDDVMTTGATASTLARLLKQAGCNTVQVWTLARTPLK